MKAIQIQRTGGPEVLELLNLLTTGAIRPVIYDRIPLAQAARAHTLLESGQVIGKVVLKP